MSLRLEKNWGAWGLDFRPDFPALESGLDQFIDWQKNFIGKDAILKEKEKFTSKLSIMQETILSNEYLKEQVSDL